MLIFRDSLVDQLDQDVIQDFRNSRLTKYIGVASLTILIWDHIITFSDEVELIWKGTKGMLVYLFFVIRYFIPLSFVVLVWAEFRTSWTLRSCSHFVRFEGAMTMIGISTVAVMMFLRIRALYRQLLAVQAIVISILITFIGVNSWLLTRGIPVHHSAYPAVDSCTMIFDPHLKGWITASSAYLPLLYDTVVVALTFFRTARGLHSKSAGQIFRVMLQEGLLYYSVICTVTLTLTVMIVSASPSVRNITAQLELCLTTTMMARITLHLKRFAHSNTVVEFGDTRWHNTRRPRLPSATRPRVPPLRVRGTPTMEPPPRVEFPLGWSTYVPTPTDTVRMGDSESLALQPFSAATPWPAAGFRSIPDRPPRPVRMDLDVLHTPRAVGDAELAGGRGRA